MHYLLMSNTMEVWSFKVLHNNLYTVVKILLSAVGYMTHHSVKQDTEKKLALMRGKILFLSSMVF